MNELREMRKQWFASMEQKLKEMHTKEDDSLFYYHSSEDRIVLSHALFWTMTLLQFFKSKMRKEKLPTVTTFSPRNSQSELCSPLGLPKELFLLLRQYEEEMLDDMDEDLCNELLDDIDYHFDKVKCRKIEAMMPQLMKMVENGIEGMKR